MPPPNPPSPAPPRQRPLYGLVMAGGFSRRFGRDKGLELHHGEALRDRAWRLIRARTVRCWMGLRPEQASNCPHPVLEDALPGEGPMAALVHAARHPEVLAPGSASSNAARADWLVLACDMPLLDPVNLDLVLAQPREGQHAVLLSKPDAAFPEPLAGIWTAEGLSILEQMVQNGERAFRAAWPLLTVDRVAPKRASDLLNLNRPSDAPEGSGLFGR